MLLSSKNYPYLPVEVELSDSKRKREEPVALEHIELGDGSLILVSIYLCTIWIGDRGIETTLAAMDGGSEVILGRGVIDEFKICLDARESKVKVYP